MFHPSPYGASQGLSLFQMNYPTHSYFRHTASSPPAVSYFLIHGIVPIHPITPADHLRKQSPWIPLILMIIVAANWYKYKQRHRLEPAELRSGDEIIYITQLPAFIST